MLGKIILIVLLGSAALAPAIYVMIDDSKPIAVRDPGQEQIQAIQQKEIDQLSATVERHRQEFRDGTDPISSWTNTRR